ncbi:hypothetical protein PM082_005140 [Marasmius tenuissimus]|nr:hypothetical protein PM082_005140 [Marasmius tenuissimus]
MASLQWKNSLCSDHLCKKRLTHLTSKEKLRGSSLKFLKRAENPASQQRVNYMPISVGNRNNSDPIARRTSHE